MDRFAAIGISLLIAFAVYAFDAGLFSVDEAGLHLTESGEEVVDETTGEVISFPGVGKRASSRGGGGGTNQDSKQLGREPTCVTPLRGCGFVMRKDEPAPRRTATAKRGWIQRLRD
jgi:hypothetical protein